MLLRPLFFATTLRQPATMALSRFQHVRLFSAEAGKDEATAAAKESSDGAEKKAASTETEKKEQSEENQIIELTNQVADLKDHLLRQVAETENVRKQVCRASHHDVLGEFFLPILNFLLLCLGPATGGGCEKVWGAGAVEGLDFGD